MEVFCSETASKATLLQGLKPGDFRPISPGLKPRPPKEELLSFGMILVSEKEKAGEGSRRQDADSYATYDSRRVTVSQGENRQDIGLDVQRDT